MFFPAPYLRRGGRFYLCWVADSWPLRFATVTQKQLWSQDVRQICDDLLEVIKNESGRPSNRFSLRLSSQLLRGLVRLYQRKVSIFVGELCMINARVMKATNKKWTHDSNDELEQPRHRLQLAVVAVEEQADEERVVERIQNSGNVVANVEDITLKEPTIQIRPLIDDGFGELVMQEQALLMPEQALAMQEAELQMQEAEQQMRAGGAVEQVSGLSLPAEESRSRLELSALRPVMEGVSEHDISVFKKSMGESQLPAGDFDKEIPDMPEIHPEPASQRDNRKGAAEKTDNQPKRPRVSDKRKKDDDEFVLDELQDRPRPKRRRKHKLIIDKSIKLTSQAMQARTGNVDVEMRCERGGDKIRTLVPASILLGRAAHAGTAARSNLGYTLARAFIRNMDVERLPRDDRAMEQALTARQRRSSVRTQARLVVEPVLSPEARLPREMQQESQLEMQQEMPQEMQQEMPQEMQQEIPADVSRVPDVEFSFLPTQIVVTSPQKGSGEPDHSPKRIRRIAFQSCLMNRRLEINKDLNDQENVPPNYQTVLDLNDQENVPPNYQTVLETNKQNVSEDQRLTQMLEAEGLADVERAEPGERERSERGRGSQRSETPLGSLDRTRVSLGESERTTEFSRFIRDEWGTQGTMNKIYQWVRRADGAVSVHSLLARGPLLPGHSRVIAARCFSSVLKLKQHGFIEVIKDPKTYEILDMKLGKKILVHR